MVGINLDSNRRQLLLFTKTRRKVQQMHMGKDVAPWGIRNPCDADILIPEPTLDFSPFMFSLKLKVS